MYIHMYFFQVCIAKFLTVGSLNGTPYIKFQRLNIIFCFREIFEKCIFYYLLIIDILLLLKMRYFAFFHKFKLRKMLIKCKIFPLHSSYWSYLNFNYFFVKIFICFQCNVFFIELMKNLIHSIEKRSKWNFLTGLREPEVVATRTPL